MTYLSIKNNWFDSVLMKRRTILPIGVYYNRCGYHTEIRLPNKGMLIRFFSQSIHYLQNIHYQFGVKSGLVSSERYLQEVPNWLPDLTIQFSPEHQIKLELLIEAHIENQLTWDKPIGLT